MVASAMCERMFAHGSGGMPPRERLPAEYAATQEARHQGGQQCDQEQPRRDLDRADHAEQQDEQDDDDEGDQWALLSVGSRERHGSTRVRAPSKPWRRPEV